MRACVGAQLTLLQGPPGTGKTKTLAMGLIAMLELWMTQGGPVPPGEGGVVLVSGPTHAAVDNVVQRAADRLDGEGALPPGLAKRVQLVSLGKVELRNVKASLPKTL